LVQQTWASSFVEVGGPTKKNTGGAAPRITKKPVIPRGCDHIGLHTSFPTDESPRRTITPTDDWPKDSPTPNVSPHRCCGGSRMKLWPEISRAFGPSITVSEIPASHSRSWAELRRLPGRPCVLRFRPSRPASGKCLVDRARSATIVMGRLLQNRMCDPANGGHCPHMIGKKRRNGRPIRRSFERETNRPNRFHRERVLTPPDTWRVWTGRKRTLYWPDRHLVPSIPGNERVAEGPDQCPDRLSRGRSNVGPATLHGETRVPDW